MIRSFNKPAGILFFLLIAAGNTGNSQQVKPVENAAIRKNLDIMDSLYNRIVTHYVEPVEPEKLMRKGISAMLESLDPFTRYNSKAEAEEFKVTLNAKFGGTGLVIREVDADIVIGQVFEGSPAEEGGIRPGDIIVSVGDLKARGKSVF